MPVGAEILNFNISGREKMGICALLLLKYLKRYIFKEMTTSPNSFDSWNLVNPHRGNGNIYG